jgi:hypothetical protein
VPFSMVLADQLTEDLATLDRLVPWMGESPCSALSASHSDPESSPSSAGQPSCPPLVITSTELRKTTGAGNANGAKRVSRLRNVRTKP